MWWREKNEELKVWAVSDPVEAITGADYIVTTLRVGGDHSRVVDERIALDLGVIGQGTYWCRWIFYGSPYDPCFDGIL